VFFFFFQAEDGIRDFHVTGVQTCALPILERIWINRRPDEGSTPFLRVIVSSAAAAPSVILISSGTEPSRARFTEMSSTNGERSDSGPEKDPSPAQSTRTSLIKCRSLARIALSAASPPWVCTMPPEASY